MKKNAQSKLAAPLTPEERHAQETELIRREKALSTYLNSGHGKPVTRRELLGSGVLGGLAILGLPTLATLIGQSAEAALTAECKTLLDPVGGMMPYMQVILGGGAALHQNTLVLDSKRQLLPSYSRLGLGLTSSFNTANEFGNVPLAVRNGVYAGHLMRTLIATAGPEAIRNTAMIKFCVSSLDDKPNRDGILGLVNATGLRGTTLPNMTTGLTKPAFVKPGPTQRVGSQSAIVSSLSPQGALKTAMNDSSRRDALLKLVNQLSAGQREKLASSSSGRDLGKYVECATGKNMDLAAADSSQLDPRTNASVSSIWNLSASSTDSSEDLVRASVTSAVLKGLAGGGALARGGYDYHGSERADQNAADAEGGILIGRILKTAHALGKPLFLHITSDGSVEGGGDDGMGRQGADAGSRGSGFILVYDPKGRVQTTDIQIGHFNTSQAVDNAFLSGWNVERCALAVFANYLQLHKKIGLLNQLAPDVFSTADLNKILKVA